MTPTLKNIRIRSTQDAFQVFNAVAMHRLPLIVRRLDAEERRAIIPGNVYVWEEYGPTTGVTGPSIGRWTDGIQWGPSRVRDGFIFHQQKESVVADLHNPVTLMRQSTTTLPPNEHHSSINPRQLPEYEPLIKQTYSVFVFLGPTDRGIKRKWHLTAYFSPTKIDELDTIDNIPGVGDTIVPDGWFERAHGDKKIRRDTQAQGTSPETHPYPSSYDNQMNSSAGLAPLAYLQSVSGPTRDPNDEQILRRFSTS
ncbi:Gti1/Pac2 family-domain-containing protein [Cyathus striatus]|nr:Gti1/Pac2 family-domain-containing protein [Cyathus striatus]